MTYARHPIHTNYLVSECGKVRHESKGQDRALRMDRYGYKRVNLTGVGRKNTTATVHRLVAETHIGAVEAGFSVNHKDGNKQNNHVSNLEIVTMAQNVTHSFKHGLRAHKKCTPITIDGVTFYSKREAERATGLPRWKMPHASNNQISRAVYK